MFVRWKRRESSYKQTSAYGRDMAADRGATISAVLVESIRVEGKPRQKFICHLAKLRERKRDYESTPFIFWRDAIGKLDSLPLDEDVRKKIEVQLAAKIPRPSDAEMTEFLRGRAEHWQNFTNLWNSFGHKPRTGVVP